MPDRPETTAGQKTPTCITEMMPQIILLSTLSLKKERKEKEKDHLSPAKNNYKRCDSNNKLYRNAAKRYCHNFSYNAFF